MTVDISLEVRINVTVHGRVNYKELLRALAEVFDEINSIVMENGLKIVCREYEVTLMIDSSRIEITGRTETMSLMRLTEKMNEIGSKILEAVEN